MKRLGALFFLFASIASLSIAPVAADKAFHSSNLELSLTAEGASAGHPQLRSGHVIDVHPNGPVNAAIERYMINGAKANTAYQVTLRIFGGGCGGDFLTSIPTVMLGTDVNGNAHGGTKFTPEDLSGVHGMVFGIKWDLVSGDINAYETACIKVTVN